MITRPEGSLDLSEYTYDVAVAKRRSGDLPTFTLIKQIEVPTASLNTVQGTFPEVQLLFKMLTSKVQAIWGLNSNPIVRIIVGSPLGKFASMADFPGFLKNSVLGVRFRKEKIGQSSSWIYGVTQYQIVRLAQRQRNVLVEGYGLLFEAIRRVESKNFGNMTAKNIISNIAKKYNLLVDTIGPFEDRNIVEVEQNVDDFTFINKMAERLNAFWFLEENKLVLISRNQMYSQDPELTLVYGRPLQETSESEFPIAEFIPVLDSTKFEAGAEQITARGIDLDTGEIVEKVFRPEAIRLGTLSLNSDQFRSNEGVTINDIVIRPSPKIKPRESGVFLPLRVRSDDELVYRYTVEQKDIEVRAVVTTIGLPRVKPGMMVRVEGAGELFSGNYVVEEVDHLVGNDKGFRTKLSLIRNALGQTSVPTPFPTNLKETKRKFSAGVKKFAEVV
jgi:hypothetical protein